MKRGVAMMTAVFATALQGVMAQNPFGISEYAQTVTLQFNSPADAAKAQLSTCPLPFNKKLAASARWDDSNTKHLDTHEVMVRNGWKGTFYLNSPWGDTKAEYCAKLIAGGCSLGVHTVTHPFLPEQNPNEHFFEIMNNRLQREADSNSSIDTLAFPFNQYATWIEKDSQRDIGQAMMNSGLIGVPTAYGPSFVLENALGYPKGTLAESLLIVPGDRDTSIEAADKAIDSAMKNISKLDSNPCLAVGIHSWHTPEGLKNLDAIFKKYSGRSDWWYCNQNEYCAYRLEANNCKITKKVDGTKATFTISRLLSSELGASVPLWLKLNGVEASGISDGASLKKEGSELFVEVPPSSAPTLERIAVVENQSNADAVAAVAKQEKLPSISAGLHADIETGKLELFLKNEGKSPLQDVVVVFRSPSGWEHGVLHLPSVELSSGASLTLNGDLGSRAKDLRYQLGKPFFVAQIDFSEGGKRNRLYATTRCPAMPLSAVCPLISLKTYAPVPAEIDFAKSSIPGEDLKKSGLNPLAPDLGKASPWAIPFSVPKEKLPLGSFNSAAVYEFESVDGSDIEITTNQEAQVFLNGQRQTGSGKTWTLKPAQGCNRLLLVYPNTDQRLQGRYLLWKGDLKFLKQS